MHDFKAIILAGGSGERFWPLSTAERPKQFLNVFGGESLIRQAFTRLAGLVEPKNVFVVTSSALVDTTRRELPELPRSNIIGEPMRRDTGAAVAIGVAALVEPVKVVAVREHVGHERGVLFPNGRCDEVVTASRVGKVGVSRD